MRKTDMHKIRDILTLRYELGLSFARISGALGICRGTVSNVLAAAADEAWLRAALYPPRERPSDGLWQALDVERMTAALAPSGGRRSPRITRRLVWEGYCAEAAEAGRLAYSYGHFCALLAGATSGTGRLQARFGCAPGDWMFSDFSGKSVPVRGAGGDWHPEIFVAVLAHSNLLYVEAVEAQSVQCWTMAHRRALEYFAGCPRFLVVNNLKAGVSWNRGRTFGSIPRSGSFRCTIRWRCFRRGLENPPTRASSRAVSAR